MSPLLGAFYTAAGYRKGRILVSPFLAAFSKGFDHQAGRGRDAPFLGAFYKGTEHQQGRGRGTSFLRIFDTVAEHQEGWGRGTSLLRIFNTVAQHHRKTERVVREHMSCSITPCDAAWKTPRGPRMSFIVRFRPPVDTAKAHVERVLRAVNQTFL